MLNQLDDRLISEQGTNLIIWFVLLSVFASESQESLDFCLCNRIIPKQNHFDKWAKYNWANSHWRHKRSHGASGARHRKFNKKKIPIEMGSECTDGEEENTWHKRLTLRAWSDWGSWLSAIHISKKHRRENTDRLTGGLCLKVKSKAMEDLTFKWPPVVNSALTSQASHGLVSLLCNYLKYCAATARHGIKMIVIIINNIYKLRNK